MAPSGEDLGVNLSHQVDEDGQWEDYTCQGQFEELIRSFETVLREWGASDRGTAAFVCGVIDEFETPTDTPNLLLPACSSGISR